MVKLLICMNSLAVVSAVPDLPECHPLEVPVRIASRMAMCAGDGYPSGYE